MFEFLAFIMIVVILIMILSPLWIAANNKKIKQLESEITTLQERLSSIEIALKKSARHGDTIDNEESSTDTDVITNHAIINDEIENNSVENDSIERIDENLDKGIYEIVEAESTYLDSVSITPLASELTSKLTSAESSLTATANIANTNITNTNDLTHASVDQSIQDLPEQSVATAESPKQPLPHLEKEPKNTSAIGSIAEPDERSIPIVTSVLHSFKNWFFGGNLVVRVGTIILLMGVVLLLRLLNDYFEIPIEVKLLAVGLISLAVAGLGLKLVKKRDTYGITLQGTGLSAAYLTAFFAYQVYFALSSLPSFMVMGTLSVVTIGLALRQNAFPLALLAFSGAFLAPLLTSNESGSLTVLFGYYLLLNVAIAIIAHYRTWKVLNLLGATVTFGLAYYWGLTDVLDAQIAEQRVSLTLITALHWLLYLFIAIRYAQQIIAYNQTQTHLSSYQNTPDNERINQLQPVLPIDTGLMFATPLLILGLFNGLLENMNHGLTVASAVMATVYLASGFFFIKRNQQKQHTLIIEGMLALGFGFTALTLALAFDANWTACGWSIQGLALVWFGRRVLRGWTVLFGLVLQLFAIVQLFYLLESNGQSASNIALFVSAVSWMAGMFILRDANHSVVYRYVTTSSPLQLDKHKLARPTPSHKMINKSWAYALVWSSGGFITFLTLCGAVWALFVSNYVLIDTFESVIDNTPAFFAFIVLSNLLAYWVIDRLQRWHEVSLVSHAELCLYYCMLLLILPASDNSWYFLGSNLELPLSLPTLIGGLILAQLWIKRWQAGKSKTVSLHSTLWLMVVIALIAQFAYYLLPDSDNVMTALLPATAMLALVLIAIKGKLTIPAWFDWRSALISTSYLVAPLLIGWIVVSNWAHDGVIWNLRYIPVFNLFDITTLTALGYLLSLYIFFTSSTRLYSHNGSKVPQPSNTTPNPSQSSLLIKVVGLSVFWVVSSILVRTLHTYADTPLWNNSALLDDKVQICLAIFWSGISLLMAYKPPRFLSNASPSFDWHKVLIASSFLLIPCLFFWVVSSNLYHDGVVWGLPYIPVLNLYDIAVLSVLAYSLKIYQLSSDHITTYANHYIKTYRPILIRTIGIIGCWALSSILVRTLHTYANTPLWIDGALLDDKVQICLTIFWSIILLLVAYKLPQWLSRKRQKLASSFNWQKAFIVSSTLFIPLMFTWIVLSNWTQDGVVWGLPYIPVLNLYDIAILLALAYGFKTHQVTADYLTRQPDDYTDIYESILLKAIGIISFWVLSSMLVRALHVYVGTPLWSDGAWGSDKVQTGLTILWTLTALIATFMSSRNGKRFWWFMGISLLGLVVLKLVLVDLSQTDAIWRVVSFIGAGSLILLIGYLAPLPPDADKPDEKKVIDDAVIDKDVIKEDADKNNKDT